MAAFTDEQWKSLISVLGTDDWVSDPRLSDLPLRLANQDYLDELMSTAVAKWDVYELMAALQEVGVPAGVCQTARDRIEDDPQLAHLGWQVPLRQSEIGTWPVKEIPVQLSETPAYIGGILDRHGPNYGEDTDRVLHDVLGLSEEQIEALRAGGVCDR